MRRTQLRFARHTLYNLKRRYGVPADLYRLASVTQDDETGRALKTKEKYHIKRLIWMPTTLLSQMNIPGQFKNPNPNFPSQDIDTSSTYFILDQKEMPSLFQMQTDDYFVVHRQVNKLEQGGRRYNIQKSIELEDGIGYLISARYMIGGQRNEVFDLPIGEALTMVEVSTGVGV
jgi:hypothetical protein